MRMPDNQNCCWVFTHGKQSKCSTHLQTELYFENIKSETVTNNCTTSIYVQIKESLSVCVLFAYHKNCSSGLLLIWHVCCWGPKEVQWWIWSIFDMRHIQYKNILNKQWTLVFNIYTTIWLLWIFNQKLERVYGSVQETHYCRSTVEAESQPDFVSLT